MAMIDTPDLDAQLDAAQAQLTASEAEAKVKESDADFAKTTYVRWQTSHKGTVSEQEREDKKAHYESSVAQLNAALARVNLDRANVDRLRYLTRFKDVIAPYDGVITERRIDIGDLVTAGSTNTTPLFGIAQFDRIRVFANFSAVAVIDETGRPRIVPNKDNSNLTPSCVVEVAEGVMEVGEFARRQWGNAPETAAARFKRDTGTSATFSISGKSFTPTQLSTFVLKRLVADSTKRLGPIAEAVITIPANFAHEAREATFAAAKAAGLNVRFIINEPTAAALYYAFKERRQMDGVFAVYDLGGGTFDISIIRMRGQNVEVLASAGIAKLGGDDFDAVLQRMVQKKYKSMTGKELPADEFTKNAAEEQKKSLSSRKQVTIRAGRQLIDISRTEFEEGISSLVTQAEMLCEATLEEANIGPDEVNAVLLSGGSTRIPLIHESVERIFGQAPVSSENVDEVVALGAALYSAYKSDRAVLSPAQRTVVAHMKVSESTGKCFGTIAVGIEPNQNERRLVNNILIKKGEKSIYLSAPKRCGDS
jgi:molecular chaperone DnaK